MTLLVRHKFAHYRRYELDIWGACFNDPYGAKVEPHRGKPKFFMRVKSAFYRFFYKLNLKKRLLWESLRQRYIYRLDMLPPDRAKKRFKLRFLSIRLTRLYYITYKDHQYRAMFRRASKAEGNMEDNYVRMIEGRLLNILYRTLFVGTPFVALRYIKNLAVYINFVQVRSYNMIVKVGTFLHFSPKFKKRLYYDLRARAKGRAFLFNEPRFLCLSFFLFVAFLLYAPKKKDLVYPITVDMQRITGYY